MSHGWPIHRNGWNVRGLSICGIFVARCIQAHEFILFADAKIIASSELRSKSWAGTCVHSFIWLFFICHFLLTFEAKTNILLVIAVAGVSFRDLC